MKLHLPDHSPIVTVIGDDGHARSIRPGESLAGLPAKIVQQIREHWTQERVAAWQRETAVIMAELTPSPGERVNAERDRRLAAGTTITAGDATIRVTVADREALAGLALDGLAGTYTVRFRDADNVTHTLGAEAVKVLWHAFVAWQSGIHAVAWRLKDGAVPADVSDDKHWRSEQ